MAAFALLAFVALALIAGEIVRHEVITKGAFPAVSDATGPSLAFLAYKNAVQQYVAHNPGTNGTIPVSALNLEPSTLALISPGNQIARINGGTQIITWTTSLPGLLSGVLQASNGDLAIGTSSGARWATPGFGDMGPLPFQIPAGDVVSVVSFTGTGF